MDNLKPKKWRKEYNQWRASINWKMYKSRDEIDNAIVKKLTEMLNEREAYIDAAVAAEREACAVECEKIGDTYFMVTGCSRCARAIRARGGE